MVCLYMYTKRPQILISTYPSSMWILYRWCQKNKKNALMILHSGNVEYSYCFDIFGPLRLCFLTPVTAYIQFAWYNYDWLVCSFESMRIGMLHNEWNKEKSIQNNKIVKVQNYWLLSICNVLEKCVAKINNSIKSQQWFWNGLKPSS